MTTSSSANLPAGLAASFDTVRLLGAGGMGAVWLVRDKFLDRLVALKVLLSDSANADLRERFLREARTSARLEHPHIIDVYRADETDGVVWFTMRYINGESLGDRLRDRGRLPVPETLRILREVSWGLAYAHARGVVHRDIKPDNILLDRDSGRAVLTDFGISRDTAYASSLTVDGSVLGSVHYMSPEQATGEAVDGQSDVYALGCVAYQMLTGEPPFDGTAQSVLVAHVTRQAPTLTGRDGIPTNVAALIEQCLRKSPSERPASADHLASAIDGLLRDAEQEAQVRADALPGGVLSEDEAFMVWQRAAQLQAEAAHRMERRAVLESSLRTSGRHAAVSSANASQVEEGYRVRDVEVAAVEAGISRQYVAIALAELRTNDQRSAALRPSSEAEDRRYTLLMGTSDRALSVAGVVQASPKATLQALGSVFTGNPFGFTLVDTVNGHPLDGGIMRFKVPRFAEAYTNPFKALAEEMRLRYRLEQIELFDLNVTLKPRGTGSSPSCEVVITGDLRAGIRRNVLFDYGLMALAGSFAFGGVAKLVAGLTGASLFSTVPVIAGAGAAITAAVAEALWYRWLFRSALVSLEEELQKLIRQVERHVHQQSLFSGEPAAGQPLSQR